MQAIFMIDNKRKMIRIAYLSLLIVIALGAIAQQAYADSCPYCHLEYGEPAPGDESRVYELRRQHEAECSVRYGSGGGGGGTISQGDMAVYIRQQQQWEEAERRRQEEERKRQEQLRNMAERKTAEAKRKQEWEQTKKNVTNIMKGSSTEGMALKSGSGSVVELKPKGAEYLGFKLKDRGSMTALEVGSQKQLASNEDSENMRRALWLYKKAAEAANPEEASFLFQQADEAAQGHPLRVEVPAGEIASEMPITKEQAEKFNKITADIKRATKERGDAITELTGVGERRKKIRSELAELATQYQAIEAAEKNPNESPESPEKEAPKTTEPEEKKIDKEKEKQKEDLLKKMTELKKQMDGTKKEIIDLVDRREKADKNLDLGKKELIDFKMGQQQ